MKKVFLFGSVLLVSLLVFIWLGYQLDCWLNTTPLCTFAGLIYALGAQFYKLYDQLRKRNE